MFIGGLVDGKTPVFDGLVPVVSGLFGCCLFSVVFNAAYTPELAASNTRLLGAMTGMMELA